MIVYMTHYTRQDLRANPDVVYVFGDNVAGKGLGGQAAAARGEPNAFGIFTKQSPSEYFSDADFQNVLPVLNYQFDLLRQMLAAGKIVVWPYSGIGTGLADLSRKSPLIWRALNDLCASLTITNGH